VFRVNKKDSAGGDGMTQFGRALQALNIDIICANSSQDPDGRFAIRHNGVDLRYRTFDKRPQVNQAAIVENKRLGPVLAYIAEKQKELDMSRSAKAPRRRGQRNHMFKAG
jgi:hypothetical protein